jgi:hypothetical protein
MRFCDWVENPRVGIPSQIWAHATRWKKNRLWRHWHHSQRPAPGRRARIVTLCVHLLTYFFLRPLCPDRLWSPLSFLSPIPWPLRNVFKTRNTTADTWKAGCEWQSQTAIADSFSREVGWKPIRRTLLNRVGRLYSCNSRPVSVRSRGIKPNSQVLP